MSPLFAEISIIRPEVDFPLLPAGEIRGGHDAFVVKIPYGFLSRPLGFWLKIVGPEGLMLSDYVVVFVSR
jgi:hypothetical protein